MPSLLNTAKQAYIALGGNMGDVLHSFRSARQMLEQDHNCTHLASSLYYQTPPLGPQDQDDFLNAVICVHSKKTPLQLLDSLQAIEQQHHRRRQQHWGPRTLDLDLLCMGPICIQSTRLCLPHAQMQHRLFVLQPLVELAPQWQHPQLKKTAEQLMQQRLAQGERPLQDGKPW